MLDTTIDPNHEKLTETILASFSGLTALSRDEMNVGHEGVRQLVTTGKPITAGSIAIALDLPELRATEILDTFADKGFAFRDEKGTVLAIWGMTVPGTDVPVSSHRVNAYGPTLYAWCALDTIYLSYDLNHPVDVSSACLVTKREMSFTIRPDSTVKDLSPAEALLSVLIPEGPVTQDVRSKFCHFVNFFANEDAGKEWAEKQSAAFRLLSIAEAAQWGKQHYKKLFSPDKF